MTNCAEQAGESLPIIVSNPHFYGSDKLVEKFVPRFKQSKDDETTLDIEPVSE